MLFEHELKIRLEESNHQYFDQYGVEYTSNSKLHKTVIPEFDPTGQILKASAKKNGLSETKMKELWIGKAQNGTNIHNALDQYWKNGKSDPCYEFLCNSIYNYYYKKGFRRAYSEQIIMHPKEQIAGTEDLIFERATKEKIVDLKDYKSDQKGIRFEAYSNDFLKAPLEFLPNCSYVTYCLKMSQYALMIERTWGYKVGSLAIIYIPPLDHMSWYEIPVPYMKREAELILKLHNNAAVSI